MNQRRIQWLGAGLSSGPGIRRIAESGRPLVLWNRTPEKARAALEGVRNLNANVQVRAFEPGAFQEALAKGDIVVSMLPANMHPEIAEVCLAKGAHLVTTSYVSEAMKSFHAEAKENGLSLINECGLDPGLDHLLAHRLVEEFRASPFSALGVELKFLSYCGGIPKEPNDFRYKFSWSPVGVLRALKNTAVYLSDGAPKTVKYPWEDLSTFELFGEKFEVYPNRDSIPYIEGYDFDRAWNLKTFVRGTLRLDGWAETWKPIFEQVMSATPEQLETLSADLWDKHAYRENEQDRVVLYVGLEASQNGNSVWSKSYALDEAGTGGDTAMAKLVSIPATYAIEWIESGEAPLGVSAAPRESAEIDRWMKSLTRMGIEVRSAD